MQTTENQLGNNFCMTLNVCHQYENRDWHLSNSDLYYMYKLDQKLDPNSEPWGITRRKTTHLTTDQ